MNPASCGVSRTRDVLRGLLVVGVSLLLVALSVAPASAGEVTQRDRVGDAHRALDITRVKVSTTPRAVRVAVRVRDHVWREAPEPRVSTMLGVHFNTNRTSRPEHLVKMDGMHNASGSTRTWNRLRPSPYGDPWGDWGDCFPRDWTHNKTIRAVPRRNLVVFLAPKACLGNPRTVRVAVQSYSPYQSSARADWARGAKRYLPRLSLR